MSEQCKCYVCKNEASYKNIDSLFPKYIHCSNCGNYIFPESSLNLIKHFNSSNVFDNKKLESYLYYHKCDSKYAFIGTNESYEKYKNKYPDTNAFLVTQNIVDGWYPKDFHEKVNYILLKLYQESKFDGDYVNFKVSLNLWLFCDNLLSSEETTGIEIDVQVEFILNYLQENELIRRIYDATFQLTPKGLEIVYNLQKFYSTSKNIFISMSFSEKTKQTREAIRNAVTSIGYSADFIDEVIHNHQIVPEMFNMIKQCKYLVLEISDPNYGAYYEAGYALGLGKEVIICCNKEVFDKKYETEEEKKFERYLKPHFDIAQKQILLWNDYADLEIKLAKWISALD